MPENLTHQKKKTDFRTGYRFVTAYPHSAKQYAEALEARFKTLSLLYVSKTKPWWGKRYDANIPIVSPIVMGIINDNKTVSYSASSASDTEERRRFKQKDGAINSISQPQKPINKPKTTK